MTSFRPPHSCGWVGYESLCVYSDITDKGVVRPYDCKGEEGQLKILSFVDSLSYVLSHLKFTSYRGVKLTVVSP